MNIDLKQNVQGKLCLKFLQRKLKAAGVVVLYSNMEKNFFHKISEIQG